MTIGEKIKKIRNAKMMTQSELAGSEITRNMLSRIENGFAQPSIGTVMYIAERLNVSPGFLLAREEDELLYFKSSEIGSIKKAYCDKNYRLCAEMCENSEWNDDELCLIFAECCLNVGMEEFSKGNLRPAAECFDRALEECEKTIYNTDIIKAKASSRFAYMRMISPTLASNVEDAEDNRKIILREDLFCVYCDIMCDSEGRSLSQLPYLSQRLAVLPEDSSYALHISAKLAMESGEYAQAYKILHKLLFENSYELPEPMLYFVFCDLEAVCRENEDFKGAYEYSGNKLALLQKLLA